MRAMHVTSHLSFSPGVGPGNGISKVSGYYFNKQIYLNSYYIYLLNLCFFSYAICLWSGGYTVRWVKLRTIWTISLSKYTRLTFSCNDLCNLSTKQVRKYLHILWSEFAQVWIHFTLMWVQNKYETYTKKIVFLKFINWVWNRHECVQVFSHGVENVSRVWYSQKLRLKIEFVSQLYSYLGPAGCLQYFTGTTGTLATFNFPLTGTLDASSK